MTRYLHLASKVELKEIEDYRARFENLSDKEILSIVGALRDFAYKNITQEDIDYIRKISEAPVSGIERIVSKYNLKL